LRVAGIVFLVTLAVFLPALRNGFVEWDDPFTIRDNLHIRGFTAENVSWMFASTYWGHYQPVVWLSYAWDHAWASALLGDGRNPAAYHLTSVVGHALATALVALVGLALLAGAGRARRTGLAAGAAALFYGLHPLRVEAVAWATGRGDVLVVVFLLLSLLAYLEFVSSARRRRAWYAASLAAYAGALLSRGTAITFAAVLVCLDVLPLGRLDRGTGFFSPAARRIWLEKLPYVVLAAGCTALALAAKSSSGSMMPLAWHGPLARLAQACYGLVFYPAKTVLPLGLSPIYELRLPLHPTAPRFLLSFAAVAGLVVAVVLLRKRLPHLAVTAAVYALLLAPVLGFGQAGNQLAADRYATLAAIPLALLAGAGLATWLRSASPSGRRAVAAVALLVLAGSSWLSVRQIGHWHDTTALWDVAVRRSPESSIAHNGYGWVRLQAKRHVEAESSFRRAIELQPGNDKAHANLWTLLREQGRTEDLIEALRMSVRVFPTYVDAHYALGAALQQAGRLEEAKRAYHGALRLNPQHVRARSNLGQISIDEGDAAGALRQLEPAVAADPKDVVARIRLAMALHQQGRRAEAVRQLETVLQIDPRNATAAELLRRYR
jgi:Flp pilus assembly protein TadD